MRRALLLAVVVTGLFVGLVGMHHLSVTQEVAAPAAATTHMTAPDEPAGQPGPAHDDGRHDSGLLHLCLAILTALAALVVSTVMWVLPTSVYTARRVGGCRVDAGPRAPPPTAPARLALLCVLRT